MPSDIFAKLGDIKGESVDAKHTDEIEVLSYSWGVGGGAGKATFHDISFVHHIDRASPLLMKACATGTHLNEAVITSRKAGKEQHEFMIVKLSDVIITGVTHNSSAGQPDSGSEMVSMSFVKVDFQYELHKADGSPGGSVGFKFNATTNKSS